MPAGISSEPKRPVRPSSGPDGTDGVPERAPGTDGYLGVRPEDCPGQTGGDCRCLLGCGICRAPPRDGWALKVMGQEVPRGNWRRQQVTANDRGDKASNIRGNGLSSYEIVHIKL